jgi:DNA-binding GntR family transcriptional regulator
MVAKRVNKKKLQPAKNKAATSKKTGQPKREKESSLTEVAYEAIKQKIITLQFGPGTYLNVASITEVLGIGRTPVHQAVRRLTHDGMIEIMPRKGMIVKPVSLHEVMDVTEARALNEPYCVRLAAKNASAKDILGLERILKRASKAAKAGNTEEQMLADRDFHCEISRIAGNKILADILKNLHERSLRFWFISLHDSNHRDDVTNEHAAIVAAIKKHNPDAAEKAMRQHIDSFRQNISQSI